MNRPFDYIGNEKVNLNNPDHREIVLQRNKDLQKAIDEGVEFHRVDIMVVTSVALQCLKCGNNIENATAENFRGEFDYDFSQHAPITECPCCKTIYSYDHFSETFKVRIPKPNIKKAKK